MYATSFISRFKESRKDSHQNVGKIILRYILGTTNYVLWYTNSNDDTLTWYTYNDIVWKINDRKNTLEYVFSLDTNLISWTSKKPAIISISFAKQEYLVTTSSSFHAL